MKRVGALFGSIRSTIEQQLVPRYQALPQREQRLLLILALFFAMTLPLFGVVLPLYDKHRSMVENVMVLKQQAAEAEQLANQLQAGGRVTAGGSVMSEVDRIARSSGIRQFMTRIRPQPGVSGNGSLLVQIKDAPYRKTVVFLAAAAEQGLGFSRVKLQSADSAGHVHLQAVITGG